MFPFGHVGFTLLAVESLRGRLPALARIDVRVLAVGALLPDLVDKPLGHALTGLGNGRILAHTLLFSLALLAAAWWAWSRNRVRGPGGTRRIDAGAALLALGIGSLMHLVLDSMWQDAYTLLWPLFGFAFPELGYDPARWVEKILTDPFTQVTEALGFIFTLGVFLRARLRGDFAGASAGDLGSGPVAGDASSREHE